MDGPLLNSKPKKRFSLKILEAKRLASLQKFKIVILKFTIVLVLALIICMGHSYGAFTVIILSSRMYREVIELKRKDELTRHILFSWVDWYSYSVLFYMLLPHLFLKRDLIMTAID